MNKKGVEISMNVIIYAAIGLLVLLVLSAIFLSRIGIFGSQASTCNVLQGAKCAVQCGNADFGTEGKTIVDGSRKCPDTKDGQTQVCCLPVQV